MKLKLADNSQLPSDCEMRLILDEDGRAVAHVINTEIAEEMVHHYNHYELTKKVLRQIIKHPGDLESILKEAYNVDNLDSLF
jgi:hypothetical protein